MINNIPTISVQELEELVAALRERKEHIFIALDGPCAAGKTTLAQSLHDRLGWTVLHMDDFFLRPEQRTPERYATPGENIDHERFLQEALQPLYMGKGAVIRSLDCNTMTFSQPIIVKPSPVVLVEGAYSCHPKLWNFYDLHLFLSVPPDEQVRRILARNGSEKAKMFKNCWIPLEKMYFSACSLPQLCDYLLSLEK